LPGCESEADTHRTHDRALGLFYPALTGGGQVDRRDDRALTGSGVRKGRPAGPHGYMGDVVAASAMGAAGAAPG